MYNKQENYLLLYQYKERWNRYVESIISVDGQDLTEYLKDEGYDVEWYDLSLESGRNAKGYMHYNPIANKYKIILHTKHLTQEAFKEFFKIIKVLKTFRVTFLDPFTGEIKTINCYRGDRKATMKWNIENKGILLNPTDISLIEL